MRILLTNDDGIDAEGLQCLYDLLKQEAECFVVAPDQGRSCCSHGVTNHTALVLASRKKNQWSLSGTPADCVRVGLMWLNLNPDIVVSGVNHGGNMGGDLLYSGTVAGAREACLLGVPSIAISQYMRRDVERDWSVSAIRAKFVFENILNRDRLAAGFWNVNLPALANPCIEQLFPISDCEPEIQPLSFFFDAEPFDGKNAIEMMENDEPRIIQTVRYKSNYQARPRTSGSDVELCFGGHATVSWLKSNPVADRI